MIFTSYIVLALGWGILSAQIVMFLKKLKMEISFLPQARYRSKPIQQSVGKSIGDMLALPAAVKDKISVLLVSSPTCPPCHEALSEFLRENERWQLPFACITEADEAEYFQKFYDDYNRFVDIIPFYRKNLKRLGITKFPTFLVINQEGVVLREFLLVPYLMKYLAQTIGKTGAGNEK
ncbi:MULTISPECIES: hypothetical protein [Bacillales]|mgnify:CR=1 FL=1|jgi:hypothetical protein|uniref:Thioredoxin-like-fold domain-containing protein n=1 Tax=Brevibacillus aydinogluensis TaxID=927786 RepID=A0AA48MCF8_9BACL|nr:MULTISPECIES: hypothetical protein [Bacillales]REK66969.1 MAG: hypothetical protein DF221_03640 [Brevibacillus sp.]MDT3416289.1 thiol-disulfide isomerase/thioredoxin [Brevibacillus aydinogluensis]NNV04415.1 hypothetical protein [Brevibacillus sp. MCWH]UFJ62619.1 hypothetical protein IRT44_07685 [Anoxybacillus sediminis]CAJ1004262.1 Thioredoxin-like-fold domain-containing protein [Brevibacillus aydinogluensis]